MITKNKIAIITFPGSNCDVDCVKVFKKFFNIDLVRIRYDSYCEDKVAGLVLPGGFSFGDYVRGGALASLTPVMKYIKAHAKRGGSILGICNGFQILTEAQILPGTLLKNISNRFICSKEKLLLGNGKSIYHEQLRNIQVTLPIAHSEGRYIASKQEIEKLQAQGQILFRYQNNPNGSAKDIAGITSQNGKIMGMMPHPERQGVQPQDKNNCGKDILKCFVESCL